MLIEFISSHVDPISYSSKPINVLRYNELFNVGQQRFLNLFLCVGSAHIIASLFFAHEIAASCIRVWWVSLYHTRQVSGSDPYRLLWYVNKLRLQVWG